MKFFSRCLAWLTASPSAFGVLVIIGICLHSGAAIKGGLYADDYVHAAYFLGSEALAQKGFLNGIAVGQFQALLADQFNFFDPASANYQALMDFGMLPWWASQDALLHFFRPLAVVTHYIDYQWWPHNTHLMHVVNLFWYALGLAAIYLLYRGVGLERSIALLALLLVVLDQSIFQVVTWIASRSMLLVLAIGFFAVYAYHRSMESRSWYITSLFSLLLALLAAEGALAICAYLGAYMFTLDRRPWLRRILHLLPFALIVVAWRIYYQSHGYGAYGVDFYLDPGREPLEFLRVASYRLPGNFFELSSGVDFFSGQVRPDLRQLFAVGGILVFAGFLWLLLPQLKSDRRLQFFLLASCFALVPGLAIALAPRVMMLPFVGFAVVLAYVVQGAASRSYAGARARAATLFCGYIGIVHILLSVGLAVYMTAQAILPQDAGETARGQVDIGVTDYAGRQVVIVNADKPFWLAFFAHRQASVGQALPASLRVMASAFYPIDLTRVAEYELRMEARPGFQYDPQPLTGLAGLPALHPIYLTQTLMGLIRASRDEWQVGQQFELPEMTIRVNALYKGKPSSLAILLKDHPLADYRWVYWNPGEKRYLPLALPAIGETIHLDGIFNEPSP